jgi:hypothetical protein
MRAPGYFKRAAGVFYKDTEAVTADTGYHYRAFGCSSQPPRHAVKKSIRQIGTEAIVDGYESIQIEKDKCGRCRGAVLKQFGERFD